MAGEGFKVADAYVDVAVNTERIGPAVSRAIKDAGKDARITARRTGSVIGSHISEKVTKTIEVDVKRRGGMLGAIGRTMVGMIGAGITAGTKVATSAMSSVMSTMGDETLKFASDVGKRARRAVVRFTARLPAMALKLTAVTGALIGVAGAALYAMGALSTAFAGSPAMLTAIVAPIGAIALGFDGIRKAAESLQKPFNDLKSQISDVFERRMAPVFEDLKAVFPVLKRGLSDVARGVSDFAQGLVDVVTSKKGLDALGRALDGTKITMERMLPGVQNLVRELGQVAGITALYESFGDTIGAVSDKLGDFFGRLRKSGQLGRTFRLLGHTIEAAADAVLGLMENSIAFFSGAGSGFLKFFDSVTNFFKRFDWEWLGAAFGGVFKEVGSALDRIPQSVLNELEVALVTTAGALKDLMRSGALEGLVRGFTGIVMIMPGVIGVLTKVIDIFAAIGRGISRVVGFVRDLPDTFRWVANKVAEHAARMAIGFLRPIGDMAAAAAEFPGPWQNMFKKVGRAVNGGIANLERYADTKKKAAKAVELKVDIRKLRDRLSDAKRELRNPALTKERKSKINTTIRELEAKLTRSIRRLGDPRLIKERRSKITTRINQLTGMLDRAKARLQDPNLTKERRSRITARIDRLRSAIGSAHGMLNSLPSSKTITLTTRKVTQHITQSMKGIGSVLGGATGGLFTGSKFKRGYQNGGLVSGPGTGTSDDVRAPWLSNGEFVVRESQTRKHRELLEAINEGKQGFQAGGLVGGRSGSTSAPAVGTTYHFAPGAITLDASKIRSIEDLLTMLNGLQARARSYGARTMRP